MCTYFSGGASFGAFAVGDTIDLELVNAGDEAAVLTLYGVPDGANTESTDELERVLAGRVVGELDRLVVWLITIGIAQWVA